MAQIQLTRAQIERIYELTSGLSGSITVGSSDRKSWRHPQELRPHSDEIQIESGTGIPVIIRADGEVAEIDLGSYLKGQPPYGNSSPENRFRVACLALHYSGSNFSEVCQNAGGTQGSFDAGWMPPSFIQPGQAA